MESISEKPRDSLLPDFRSFGVVLRILLGGVAMGAVAALVSADRLADWDDVFVRFSLHLQPVLLLMVALTALLARPLARLSAWAGAATVVALTVLVTLMFEDMLAFIGLASGGNAHFLRSALLAAVGSSVLLAYFALRAKALHPAAAEARLAALAARIRPHFLFNSLNAVLSLIRSDPRRAEAALEGVAELFRVLMRDPRDLVPLSDEIALCRQYLDLERLRLGERLRVVWEVSDVPDDALVPPLMLQPLLENAVYHGIEPLDAGGEIRIRFARDDDALCIELENPLDEGVGHSAASGSGNRMALANISERLNLHFDLDAQLSARVVASRYLVSIRLPYRS